MTPSPNRSDPLPKWVRCPIFRPISITRGFVLPWFFWSVLSCGGGTSTVPSGPSSPGVPTPAPAPTPVPPPMIGSPCAGVVVRGEPPHRGSSVTRATLVVEWEIGSGGGFDWSGPYYDDGRNESPLLEVNVADWRIETTAAATRHIFEIEWPPFLDAGMIFRSDVGACALPALLCSSSGCALQASP